MTVFPHFRTMPGIIGVFLFDGFQLLDASGPIAAVELAGRLSGRPYCLELLSLDGGAIRSSSGVSISTRRARQIDAVDTLIVPGGVGIEVAMACTRSLTLLATMGEPARRVCGVCSGAFLLASAGMLDGRRATTHWAAAAELKRRFPSIQVDADHIYVRDGRVWTSAGVTAGIDLALAMIADDLGEAIARRTAQEMVVYYRRPGGQSQFSALAALGGGEDKFSSLLEWIRSNLAEPLTVERLADRMAMSPRNFSRAFLRSVGVSPAKAIERLRLEAARERVENSRDPIEVIAVTMGFNDPERMRRAFVRAFGLPPLAMRRHRL